MGLFWDFVTRATGGRGTVELGFPSGGSGGSAGAGARIIARDLNRFADEFASFREPLRESVKDVMIPSIRKTFFIEGRPPWVPLDVSTIRKRKATGPILRVTHRLFSEATSFGIWSIDRHSASITDLDRRVKYAKFHQTGTKHMPRRVFLAIHPEDEEDIERVFMRWVINKSITVAKFK